MKDSEFCAYGERSLPAYLEGSMEAAAARTFAGHVAGCTVCREQLKLWDCLAALPVDPPSEAFRQGLPGLARGTAARPWVSDRVAAWGMAAMLALLAGTGGYWLGAREGAQQVALVKKDVEHLRGLVAVGLLQQPSAVERLRGVNYTARLSAADEGVVEALLTTLRTDGSVDVRLAALEALRQYEARPRVRQEVSKVLRREDSPMVQMVLLETLAAWRERSAEVELAALAADEDVEQGVRERARELLAQWREKQEGLGLRQ
ncbi:MAG: hypothetical protein OHK0021_20040 [Bryobacter sp.]